MAVILLNLVLLAALVACLEMAFQFFMMPNMILYPYGVLLSKLSHVNNVFRHLASPLGRCPYCNGTWVAFYVYKYFYGVSLPVLLLIGVTMLFVYLLQKHIFFKVEPAYRIDSKLYGVKYAQEMEDIGVADMLYAYLILIAVYAVIYFSYIKMLFLSII